MVPRDRNQNTMCFKCRKMGHFAADCVVQALHIGECEEENVEEFKEIQVAEEDLVEEYEGDEEPIESSDLLGVVRCILAQTKKNEDWRRTNILQTFIKLGDKVCNIIIDSGSCVNAISTNAVKSLGLPTVPLPSPYKVSWIDATSILIKL